MLPQRESTMIGGDSQEEVKMTCFLIFFRAKHYNLDALSFKIVSLLSGLAQPHSFAT